MAHNSQIRAIMEVVSTGGARPGRMNRDEGDRIKLTTRDSGADIEGAGEGLHTDHSLYIPAGSATVTKDDPPNNCHCSIL